MGYYTIRLNPNAQRICTIILPWGKYSYLRLPMGMSGLPDIFQEKMSDLMRTLEYKQRLDFDYTVGQKVLLKKDGILRKAEDKYDGPYVITNVYTNGTVRIQRGTINERLNIRRLTPYFERET